MTAADMHTAINEAEEKLKLAKTFEDPVERDETVTWVSQEIRQLEAALARRNGKPSKAVEPKARLIATMDEIKAEKVDWLWSNRIPLGRLTLLDGDPGVGKSWLALAIASAVTKAEALPSGEKPRSPGNVLLMSCEDGLGDTVRPRLDQLGADVSKIAVPDPTRGLATAMLNASFIEQAVKQLGPKLVIIDPIAAFSGRRNTQRSDEVRELLSPLMALAERYVFACLLIRHFTKMDAKALYRGSGAIDFVAACRSLFLIVESDEQPDARVLAHVKNSLGPKVSSITFTIDANGFRWGNEINVDADELLVQSQSQNRKKDKSQTEAACEFLRQALAKREVASILLEEDAEKLGLRHAIWRAKPILGIKARKGAGGRWFWSLPAAKE
jgi:predicted ATP-dependent serine protease